ncbi:hypothetical protein [Streptosporangium sandarakinum]
MDRKKALSVAVPLLLAKATAMLSAALPHKAEGVAALTNRHPPGVTWMTTFDRLIRPST